MKKILTLLLLCFIMNGCRHLDNSISGHSNSFMSFEALENHYLFKYEPVANFKSDSEITAPLKFLIKLPKGINDYRIISSKDFFFFYPKGQMVYIQAYPHKESERSMIPGDSALKTTDMYQVLNKLNDINGWEQKFSKPNANRKTAVIHIDEKSKIILYNVLSQNKSDWEGLLTSFHYLD